MLHLPLTHEQQVFCEACAFERFGNSSGQCEYCRLYPQNLHHWNDAKPNVAFYVCVR